MSVIRIKKNRTPYVTLNTTALNDARLSFRAKGLHTYLMSKPDDWQVYIEQLEKESPTEGRDAIRTALKELEMAGYISREKRRGEKGRLAGWDTTIYETAELAEAATDAIGLDESDQPKSDQPKSDQPQLLNLDLNQDLNLITPPLSPSGERSPLTSKVAKATKRCAADYHPTDALKAWAAEKYPQIDFEDALEAMRDYEFQKPHSDWDATLRTWIRTEAKRSNATRGTPPLRPHGLTEREYRTLKNSAELAQEILHGAPHDVGRQSPLLPSPRSHGPDIQ